MSIFAVQIFNYLQMENKKKYKIPIVALKNKVHHFEYKIDGTFFNDFENNTINKSEIKVEISLEKRDTLIILMFYIDGTVELSCDRCLDVYTQEIFGDYKLILQFGGEIYQENDNDDDIVLMDRNTDFIDVSKPMYDYTLLSLPIQQIHSNINDCNQNMIDYLKNSKQTEKQEIDPRWEILNKLKNKKNGTS